MAYLGRKGAVAPLTSADIPVGIVEGTDIAFLENASGQDLSGTYSTERMYLAGRTGSAPNDYNYKLVGNIDVTGHLALGSIADDDVIITQDSTERTITGSGTLEAGELLSSKETDLTEMTGSPTLITPALGTPASGVLTNCTMPSAKFITRWAGSGTQTFARGIAWDLTARTSDTSIFTYSNGVFTCVLAGVYLFHCQFATGTVNSQWTGWAKNYSGASGSFAQTHMAAQPAYARSTDTAYLPKTIVNPIRCAVGDEMAVRSTVEIQTAGDQTMISITYIAP